MELQLPYDDAFNLCIESLNVIKRHKIRRKDITEGKIVARAGITLWSAGEIISFYLNQIDDQKTRIEIASRPLIPTRFFDYGKNVENVEKIIQFLRQRTSIQILSSNILSFLLSKV